MFVSIIKIFLPACILVMAIVGCNDSSKNLINDGLKEEVIIPGASCIDSDQKALEASMGNLASVPEKYEGLKVKTSGYYYRGFEHSALYPDRRDPDEISFSEGAWLMGMYPYTQFAGQMIEVEGEFSTKSRGHLGQWFGSICVVKARVLSEAEQ